MKHSRSHECPTMLDLAGNDMMLHAASTGSTASLGSFGKSVIRSDRLCTSVAV